MAKVNTLENVKPTFEQSDIEQIVNGMFNRNRTVSNVQGYEVKGNKLTIIFTNKNSDGSNQKVKRSFVSDEAAMAGYDCAVSKIAAHRQIDRTMDFSTPQATA